MRITPVNNTSFNGLHIMRSPEMKQFIEDAVQSDEDYKILEDTFQKIDEKAGENSVYLNCGIKNDEHDKRIKLYRFTLNDSTGKNRLDSSPCVHVGWASNELDFFCNAMQKFDIKMSDKLNKFDFFTKYN